MEDALPRSMQVSAPPDIASRTPRARLIVLAEDDPALRDLIASALEMDGHRVVQVGTGSGLVSAVREILLGGREGGTVDLLISDVRMPELSGLDALQLLRDEEVQIPIILITAFSDLWTRTEAARHGARLLDKPLELRVLRQMVRNSLAG
jgi:DNA-binding response OmpR family regulator